MGITTGLPCANQVANLFSLGLDSVAHSAFEHIFFMKRYLDDLLVCFSYSIADFNAAEQARITLCGWDNHIKCTTDATETGHECHFLDLSISVDTFGRIRHTIYFKPLSRFMYTPFNSNHSNSTKAGIFLGELNRLRINCDDDSNFISCAALVRSKLIDRGYPAQFLDDCEEKYKNNIKNSGTQKKSADMRPLILFKIPYGSTGRRIKIMSSIRTHFHLLNSKGIAVLNSGDIDDNDDDDDVLKHSKWRFLNCYTSSLNLFRRRYSRFLGSTG